jgi:hypothetical protein
MNFDTLNLLFLATLLAACLHASPLPHPVLSKVLGCLKDCFDGKAAAAKAALREQEENQRMAAYFLQLRQQQAAAQSARASSSNTAPASQMEVLNQDFAKVVQKIQKEKERGLKPALPVQVISDDPTFHAGGKSLEKSSRTKISGGIPEDAAV